MDDIENKTIFYRKQNVFACWARKVKSVMVVCNLSVVMTEQAARPTADSTAADAWNGKLNKS